MARFGFLGTAPKEGVKTQSFALTKDKSGNIVIDHKVRFDGVALQISDDKGGILEAKTDKAGYAEIGLKITIPVNNLESLSRADWTKYDHTEIQKAEESSHPDRFTEAEGLIPSAYSSPARSRPRTGFMRTVCAISRKACKTAFLCSIPVFFCVYWMPCYASGALTAIRLTRERNGTNDGI